MSFLALLFVQVLQVQVDLSQAWVGMSLVGIAEEAGCTAAQVSDVLRIDGAGDACHAV